MLLLLSDNIHVTNNLNQAAFTASCLAERQFPYRSMDNMITINKFDFSQMHYIKLTSCDMLLCQLQSLADDKCYFNFFAHYLDKF